MDITYFVAGFIALVIGLVAGVVFVIIRGKSTLRLIAAASAIAVVLDGALLIDWSHIGEAPVWIIVIDCLVFTTYSIVGCTAGAFPALAARSAWRNRSSKDANSN